jgi:hypothetical protein
VETLAKAIAEGPKIDHAHHDISDKLYYVSVYEVIGTVGNRVLDPSSIVKFDILNKISQSQDPQNSHADANAYLVYLYLVAINALIPGSI